MKSKLLFLKNRQNKHKSSDSLSDSVSLAILVETIKPKLFRGQKNPTRIFLKFILKLRIRSIKIIRPRCWKSSVATVWPARYVVAALHLCLDSWDYSYATVTTEIST